MKNYNDIFGWFSDFQAYDYLASTVPDGGVFVECGAWLGKSSSYLCDIAQDRFQVYIVETWKGSANELSTSHKLATETDIYEIFLSNMGKRKFTPIRQESIKASESFNDNSLDVVFIDMEHTYEAVTKDINAWYPKVKNGGYISGHDYKNGWHGVDKAVHEHFNIEKIIHINACWIVHKE